VALDGAGGSTLDDPDTRDSFRVDPHRRDPRKPSRVPATHTKADEQLYAEGLDQVQILADARRMRLVAAEEGIPGVLWAVLIFGGVAAIGFTYLFGLENTWAHRLMVFTLAAVIGLVLFTIGAMEHPFSGGARIGTGAFDLILERFETSKLSDIR
jgi:Protein of unknown function (DUF4239)